jgi:hypothetical protein
MKTLIAESLAQVRNRSREMWGIKTPIIFKNLKGKSLAIFLPEGDTGYLITRSMLKKGQHFGFRQEFEPAMKVFEACVLGKDSK